MTSFNVVNGQIYQHFSGIRTNNAWPVAH